MALPFGFLALLAHTGEAETSGAGRLAMTIMLVTVLTVIWILVGVVCWIFWRAKKREDAVRGNTTSATSSLEEKPGVWRNARSS